jgi:hypothetical protein
MKNKISKDFWTLMSVGWIAVILGLIVDTSRQSQIGKFLIGMVLGIGIACLIIGFVLLLRGNKKWMK